MIKQTNTVCNTDPDKNIVIIGAGAWGSALSIALTQNFNNIFLICHNEKQLIEIKDGHPVLQVKFAKNITLTTDYQVLKQSDSILIATPSYAFSEVLLTIKPYLVKHKIAWATKGFANEKLLHQTFAEILIDFSPCVISGPSFALEVANSKPTALVVASSNKKTSEFWAKKIQNSNLRVYISNDITGVEIGGAVKNIIAIASGISSGLGFGTNTMSALITRGLAEMSRLGISLGAKQQTFMGLTGLGDLTLTCLDDLSRNRRFGKEIAKNNNVATATKNVGATVEGLNALTTVLKIAKKQKIEMPICEKIEQIINNKITPLDAVKDLMARKIAYENN